MSSTRNNQQLDQTRCAAIESLVRQRGFVTIKGFAVKFRATVQIVRRALVHLSNAGCVARFHGDAGPPSRVANIDCSTCKVLDLVEKNHIAKLAAQHTPSTPRCVSISAPPRLARDHQQFECDATRHARDRFQNYCHRWLGAQTRGGMIDQFRVDIGVIGIDALDANNLLLDYDELHAAQNMVRNARQSISTGRPHLDHTSIASEHGLAYPMQRFVHKQISANRTR